MAAFGYGNSTFTYSELLQLMKKAENVFEMYSFEEAAWIYRDKPLYGLHSFNEAYDNNYIMKTYQKDSNGDPKSPINRNINGLFFQTYQPPESYSYFGNTRIRVPGDFFLSSQAKKQNRYYTQPVRLYFADFYCMDRRNARHWVTLVLTYRHSTTDQFCQGRLPELDLDNNKFFKISHGTVQVRGSNSNRVEVYYTEDIDLNHWKENGGIIESVSTVGRGCSTPGGKRKRPDCSTCNLYWPL